MQAIRWVGCGIGPMQVVRDTRQVLRDGLADRLGIHRRRFYGNQKSTKEHSISREAWKEAGDAIWGQIDNAVLPVRQTLRDFIERRLEPRAR